MKIIEKLGDLTKEVLECLVHDGLGFFVTTKDHGNALVTMREAEPDWLCKGCDASIDYTIRYVGGREDGGQYDYDSAEYGNRVLDLMDTVLEFAAGEEVEPRILVRGEVNGDD